MTDETQIFDGDFGLCPVCHKFDGFANAGKSHRFYCKEHKASWLVGSNIFSSWRDQTEEEQRRIWNEIGLNEFADVEPYFRPQEQTLEEDGCFVVWERRSGMFTSRADAEYWLQLHEVRANYEQGDRVIAHVGHIDPNDSQSPYRPR